MAFDPRVSMAHTSVHTWKVAVRASNTPRYNSVQKPWAVAACLADKWTSAVALAGIRGFAFVLARSANIFIFDVSHISGIPALIVTFRRRALGVAHNFDLRFLELIR